MASPSSTSYGEVFSRATGHQSYAYQAHIGEHGLPQAFRAPTGSGKTEAIVIGWLFRKLFHPEQSVQQQTARQLVLALPTRALTEQTTQRCESIINNLGIDNNMLVDERKRATRKINVV